jgi:L-lactate dehydrogenase
MGMKVSIIGAGNVGATIAYTLLVKGGCDAISIIDTNQDKAIGEAEDLSHGLSLATNVEIRAEGYEGIQDADVIVVTAGRNRRPGETRLDLGRANVGIMEDIVRCMKPHYRDAIIIMVSNPVDILTEVAFQRMGVAKGRLIGSGTVLDSSRFRFLLSQEFAIDSRNIHAYVIGEHGDSAVPVWSMASLGQIPVTHYAPAGRQPLGPGDRKRIENAVQSAGKAVIQHKGATFYAIALSVCSILEAIVGNEHSIHTVSSHIDDFLGVTKVSLSLPAVIAREGIRELLPIQLDAGELAGLRHSADVLKAMLVEIGY